MKGFVTDLSCEHKKILKMSSKGIVDSKVESKTELSEKEVTLVKWEEWALSAEEHFHALELWQRRPNGLPMGHHR